MTIQRFARTICFGLFTICLASYSHADSLELQNGEIIEGLFKGGTQNSIRFFTGGSLKNIPVTDILALTISRDASPAEPVEPVAPVLPAAPVEPTRPIEPVSEIEEMPVEHVHPVAVQEDILAPVGTTLLVRFMDDIDSREHKVGHRFTVMLESDFTHDGIVIAPTGTKLYGVLVDAKQAGRIKGKTHLTLELTEIRLKGQLHPIATGEYILAGKKSAGKRSAIKVLAGAAIGAVINDDNRLEGAAVGAGVGLGVAAITRGEQITIPKKTLIEFQLRAPFSL